MRSIACIVLTLAVASCASPRPTEQLAVSEHGAVPNQSSTYQVVPLKHASANQVANMLESLLSESRREAQNRQQEQRAMAKPGAAVAQPHVAQITVIADQRTNSLVLGVPPGGEAELQRVLELIRELDAEVVK